MIEAVEIRDYGCIRHVEGKLTPLHAFIGPNDSGKSTLLRAIGTAAQLWSHEPFSALDQDLTPRRPFDPRLEGGAFRIRLRDGEKSYLLTQREGEILEQSSMSWHEHDPGFLTVAVTRIVDIAPAHRRGDERPERGVALVRLDAQRVGSLPELMAVDELPAMLANRGSGLVGVMHSLRLAALEGDDRFQRIEEAARSLFPVLRSLRVEVAGRKLRLIGTLDDGQEVRGERMSEGLLLMLAYLVIEAVGGPRLLLVEEPENGLHPHRIKDVVRVLRNITERGTQVLIATHSPLVINELQPEEVTLVTRPDLERGTILTPMTETKNFADRSVAFDLGELWLFHADGDREAGLTGEKPEAAE